MTAIGRRIRRNYFWILLIQTLAYAGKIAVHPTGVTSLPQAVERADIGPFPGELVLATGVFYILLWGGIAWWSTSSDAARARRRSSMTSMG
ncbi:MAG: DUF2270 domain-containing protein, partial [Leisingera sp.]